MNQVSHSNRRSMFSGKLIIALLLAAFSLFSYLSSSSLNPVTGQKQRVALSVPQEVALGLQAVPAMTAQYGGVSGDLAAARRVSEIGQQLLAAGLKSSPYGFDFHLLADSSTVNAFALPGGQIFITEALYRLLKTDGQLAAVLGHEIGHVVERHSAQQIAKAQLTQGLTGAAVLATYDPDRPETRGGAQVAALIGQLVTLRFGRNDELESDVWGVRLAAKSGYDPHAEIEVMKILESAGGSNRMPEFFSTHPNPENRIEHIKAAIAKEFPNGVPSGLKP